MREEDEAKYRAYTQQDFYKLLEGVGNWLMGGDPVSGNVHDFFWNYESAFPLTTIRTIGNQSWSEWHAEEMRFAEEDDRLPYYQALASWWKREAWKEPLVLAEGYHSVFYCWDGQHRIGLSFAEGIALAPAFVGRRIVAQKIA